MTDEEFVFNQTVKERKRNGYGDRNKVRQGGKTVRMPSDYLSKKEKKALNGEVTTVKLNSPVKWDVFSKWNPDLQRSYLNNLFTKHGATWTGISVMLGRNYTTVWRMARKIGYEEPQHERDAEKWQKFLTGDAENPVAELAEAPAVEQIPAQEEKPVEEAKPIEEKPVQKFSELAKLFEALAGSGAKITIELTL